MEAKADPPSSADGSFVQPRVFPDQETAFLESLVRADYERSHPGETFEDMKRRSRFSADDKGLLREWMALASQRAAAAKTDHSPK